MNNSPVRITLFVARWESVAVVGLSHQLGDNGANFPLSTVMAMANPAKHQRPSRRVSAMTTAPLTHLGNLDIETFLRDYWQQKPCLIRNAIPDFAEVISADELAGMACDEQVESRLLIAEPDSGQFELLHGPFEESRFGELPDSHWSLLIQGVDHWIPEAADLVERFRFIPSWRLDDLMISYSTDGGGVGPHYDNYDVFIIQASGRRRWEIGGHYLERETEFLPDQPVRILKQWQPEQVWELEPGDMIYIPPRVGHNGIALGNDCINYSVGYRAPHAHEMLHSLSGFCEHNSVDELRYSDPALSPRSASGAILEADMAQVRQLLQSLTDDNEQLTRWWGEYVTEPKQPHQHAQSLELPLNQLRDELAEAASIRRSEGVRYAHAQTPSGCTLFVDGHSYPLPAEAIELAQLLSGHNSYRSEQLQHWLEQPACAALLVELFRLDRLYIDG